MAKFPIDEIVRPLMKEIVIIGRFFHPAGWILVRDIYQVLKARFELDQGSDHECNHMLIPSIARAKGIELGDDFPDLMINADPENTFFKPSMQQDIEKVHFYASIPTCSQ